LQHITTELQAIYDKDESRNIAFLLLAHLFGLTRSAILTDKHIDIADTSILQTAVDRLKEHEPIQYVTGTTEFMGRLFKVNSHVLIPRPETEELVSVIINENKQTIPNSILDIGTGSGCIAISLAAAWPQSEVTALDVSEEALQVAWSNAGNYVQNVKFMQANILDTSWQEAVIPMQLDIVVSNPPYVTHAEEPLMRRNVTGFEPHIALFVDDTDPLLFYRYIAKFCTRHLKRGGLCYLEINEQYGEQVKEVFLENLFSEALVLQDMFGKNRFVKGIL
jgi:release factor glutamine methyltransferase